MADLTEQIETVLRENGIGEPESTLHSWRCSYPDQYGPCNCLAELVGDLAALLATREAEAARRALVEAAEALSDCACTYGCFEDVAALLTERAAGLGGAA